LVIDGVPSKRWNFKWNITMDTAIENPSSSNSLSATCSPAELRALIGRADTPLILDVRREAKFASSTRTIAGAVRCAPEHVEAFARQHPPQSVVVYCVYGHNVSEDAAKALNAAGWNARALAGGIEGGEDGVDTPENIALWRSQGLPTMTKRADWGVTGEAASRWVTRAQPKIDRIACPWLIRRFIDPRAEFFYVPADQVLSEAKRLNAVAFDIPGAPVSHSADQCTFDALVQGFDLHSSAFELMARIVRGADTDCGLAGESAGLLAISLGLSRIHAGNDHAMLDAAMPMYDALHAWCQDKAAGRSEVHRWKQPTLSDAALRRLASQRRQQEDKAGL
jgi:rhodanese-related sulfurtransferase